MTLFIADIASYQKGLTTRQLQDQGFSAVIVKCSQGAGYINPLFQNWIAEAQSLGMLCSSYHYLNPGNWDAQAAEILRADPDPAIPVWLDAEAGAGLNDAVQVADRLRKHGQHLAGFYGPKPPVGYGGWWRAAYYSDPTGFGSAVYARQGGDTGPGWASNPDLWQFCQHGRITGFSGDVDFSAYRGTIDQLTASGWFWAPAHPATPITPAPEDDMQIRTLARAADTGAVYLIKETPVGLRSFHILDPGTVFADEANNGADCLTYDTEAALQVEFPPSAGHVAKSF